MDQKKNKIIGLIIALVVAIGMVLDIITLVNTAIPAQDGAKRGVFVLINYLVILYYITIGYKKPHGNLLKYAMLIYAINMALNSTSAFWQGASPYEEYGSLQLLIALCVTYMAGRLNKLKNNMIISGVILCALLLGIIVCYTSSVTTNFDKTYSIVLALQWVVLAAAYCVRYKAHIEAGFDD